jgi:hypothetical protein
MKHILWVVTLALCCSIYANAQTIADVARRERARQQPQSNVSFTNADLKKKTPVTTTEEKKPGETQAAAPAATNAAAPAATNTAAPASSATQASTQAPASTDPRDEKWWRDKFDAARTDIRRAENQIALAQLEVNSANRDYITRSYDPGNVGLTAVATAQKKLDDANKALTTARGKLAQLENDLRQAGAPAGWAR